MIINNNIRRSQSFCYKRSTSFYNKVSEVAKAILAIRQTLGMAQNTYATFSQSLLNSDHSTHAPSPSQLAIWAVNVVQTLYKEATAAYEQALYLDENVASAYGTSSDTCEAILSTFQNLSSIHETLMPISDLTTVKASDTPQLLDLLHTLSPLLKTTDEQAKVAHRLAWRQSFLQELHFQTLNTSP